MQRILHISAEEIEKQSALIFAPVKNGENAVGLCYPMCKIGYNLSCFLDDKNILKKQIGLLYRKIVFLAIHLDAQEDEFSFNEKIIEQLNRHKIKINKRTSLNEICERILYSGKEIYFFILDAHLPPADSLSGILNKLQNIITNNTRVRATLFFESNIFDEKIAEVLKTNHIFLQNVSAFPTYSPEEAKKFVVNLAHVWGKAIDMHIVDKMVKTCGGYLWLLKSALKIYLHNQNFDLMLNSPVMKLKIQTLYNTFTDNEKRALATVCFEDKRVIDQKYFDYFESTGVIIKKQNNFEITPSLLAPLLKRNLQTKLLTVNTDGITYHGKPISHLLTPFEHRILELLLRNKGHIVERDKIAQYLWGENWTNEYSDWALDKLISKLRQRLVQIGMPKHSIVAKKRQGFLLI